MTLVTCSNVNVLMVWRNFNSKPFILEARLDFHPNTSYLLCVASFELSLLLHQYQNQQENLKVRQLAPMCFHEN